MKHAFCPMLVLTLLVGGCSSLTTSRISATPAPVRVAARSSVWGEIPSYRGKGQSFQFPDQVTPTDISGSGRVAVDVLVNRDGTVRDAAIVRASGEPSADKRVVALYRAAHYSLQLRPDDPAPYVVRQTVVLRPLDWASGGGIDYSNYHFSPNYTETYSPTPNTVNGMFR